jgi:Tfp pilus assembly protein PilF
MYVDVLNDYGYFLYVRGDLSRAEEVLRQSLSRRADHPKASVNLGMVLAAQGRFDEAFSMFETSVGPAAAHHNIGLLMERVGREVEALAHLHQAVDRDPSLQRTQAILAQWDSPANDRTSAAHESFNIFVPSSAWLSHGEIGAM